MSQLVEGYALVTAKGHYLTMEQVASHDIEVLTFANPDMATLHTLDLAIQTKKEIIDNNGYWNYSALEEQIPVGIVKITKLIKVEEVAE
ncbi:hypothetical protein PQE71_gp070 [Bacillus phage Izhevsk]|uniref:Uncharacterized protein n=1 Tax=Bacillus phage Izhevsk TaxID=2724322 RepID=A0A6H0X685_9CAUD|nr:hypothetical protein PQE71_gp070 [Bacillus phage Izhevsk]QIW89752.1 hypothetical protein Izhevsk_71 [Bacillus phage Izhevsk]